MDMLATLRRSGGIEALARELGIPSAAAAAGTEALLPAIVAGFRQHRDTEGGGEAGLSAVATMLEGLGGGSLAAAVMGPDAADFAPGNGVLGAIFGTKDVSRILADQAAQATGLEPAMLKRMLPLLAMLVGGYLSARATGSGAEGSRDLASIGTLIDASGESHVLDDIMATAGKLTKP